MFLLSCSYAVFKIIIQALLYIIAVSREILVMHHFVFISFHGFLVVVWEYCSIINDFDVLELGNIQSAIHNIPLIITPFGVVESLCLCKLAP